MIDRNLKLAVKMIKSNGRSVGLVSYVNSGTDYDPTLTSTTTTTKAVQSNFNTFQVDGTVILATDRKYLFAGDVEPAIGMDVLDGGITYKIKNVWQVKPGDTLILSKVQAGL